MEFLHPFVGIICFTGTFQTWDSISRVFIWFSPGESTVNANMMIGSSVRGRSVSRGMGRPRSPAWTYRVMFSNWAPDSTTFASIARVRRVHCHRTKHDWKWQRPTHDSLRASAVSIKVKMQVIWQRKQSSVVIWLDGTRIAIPRNMTSTLKRDAVVSSSKHFDTGCYEFGS